MLGRERQLLRRLVGLGGRSGGDCVESGRPTISRPEHALHALEIMLAAQAAGSDGVARMIESDFPDLSYDAAWLGHEAERHAHDRRSHEGL